MKTVELTNLKGVGPSTAKHFAAIGINNVFNLLHFFPRDYHDYSQITPIKSIKPGMVTVRGQIKHATGKYIRRGMHITEAIASDESGSIKLVWFNQPYRAGGITNDQDYYITGKLEFRAGRFSIVSPSVELISDMPVHTARIVPIYRQSKDLKAKLIRKAMSQALSYANQLPEIMPANIAKKYELLTYSQALKQLHFPHDKIHLDKAIRTLSFIEVFELMLASKILKKEIASEPAPIIKFNENLARKFVQSLPFKLTDAQRKAMWQILQDMEKSTPANRLLEGDVGSGKTVVAAMAGLMAISQGFQVALLAPTEILAKQHADSISDLLAKLDMSSHLSLLVGSQKSSQKKINHQRLKDGSIKFVIGTHALLQELEFKNLGLIIIDEQHRFGVEQRKQLLKQMGKVPHVLSMTATPIPRSLALTLYGELDISLLDAMPPGRKPIKTEIVSPNSRQKMEQHIAQEIGAGHQVYIVCPVITEDNKLQTASAEAVFKRLSTSTFKDKRIGLLHGKLKNDEKTQIMERFVAGELDILVATTVIEVGVNVPNATIMVIEGADRFGLAQLHQLRGRVGRSTTQGYCYVVPSDSQEPSKRLRSFTRINDGFKLAEIDLELRGPGAIYGTMQHGALDLKFANLSDHKLLAEVKKAVQEFIDKDELSKYPELKRRVRLAQAVITLN